MDTRSLLLFTVSCTSVRDNYPHAFSHFGCFWSSGNCRCRVDGRWSRDDGGGSKIEAGAETTVRVAESGSDESVGALGVSEGAAYSGRAGWCGDRVSFDFPCVPVRSLEEGDRWVDRSAGEDEEVRVVDVDPGVGVREGDRESSDLGDSVQRWSRRVSQIEDDRSAEDDGRSCLNSGDVGSEEVLLSREEDGISDAVDDRNVGGVGVPGFALRGREDLPPLVDEVGHGSADGGLLGARRVGWDGTCTGVHPRAVV